MKRKKSFLKIREPVLCGCILLQETIENDGELPGNKIDFWKVGALHAGDGMFTRKE